MKGETVMVPNFVWLKTSTSKEIGRNEMGLATIRLIKRVRWSNTNFASNLCLT